MLLDKATIASAVLLPSLERWEDAPVPLIPSFCAAWFFTRDGVIAARKASASCSRCSVSFASNEESSLRAIVDLQVIDSDLVVDRWHQYSTRR